MTAISIVGHKHAFPHGAIDMVVHYNEHNTIQVKSFTLENKTEMK